uniref:Uncharacterized protein n=1 Tax=Schistocephalus solidus TaxID=70667 RepID=A0A0X3NLI8_SCHSO
MGVASLVLQDSHPNRFKFIRLIIVRNALICRENGFPRVDLTLFCLSPAPVDCPSLPANFRCDWTQWLTILNSTARRATHDLVLNILINNILLKAELKGFCSLKNHYQTARRTFLVKNKCSELQIRRRPSCDVQGCHYFSAQFRPKRRLRQGLVSHLSAAKKAKVSYEEQCVYLI